MARADIVIDGSQGEGGGQILRSSLALSLVTGQPFRIEKIRAGRKKPGLLRQHLTAVQAAAEVGGAKVQGDPLGSQELSFSPGTIRAGEYRWAVGTAGSTTLVLQTVLPALMIAREPSRITLEGGTHNPYAPPFDFLEHAFLPLIRKMGPEVGAHLERPGFYPAGGGMFTVEVRPAPALRPIEILERGEIRARLAHAVVAALPISIAHREIGRLLRDLGWKQEECRAQEVGEPRGPGNIVIARIDSEHVTELFTGFGERGHSAEEVAAGLARDVRRYLDSGAPVGPHLADQLLVPMAMAGGGTFRTNDITPHTRTNMAVIRQFTGTRFDVTECDGGYTVSMRKG